MNKLLLLKLLIVISFISYGQTVKYVTVDYLTDNSSISLYKEKFDSKVGLKIINVNKLLVDISKDVQKTSFNETVPSLFESFAKGQAPAAAPAGNNLAPGSENLFVESDMTAASFNDAIKARLRKLYQDYRQIALELQAMDKRLIAYGEQYKNFKSLLQYHQNLVNLQKTCNTKFSDIQLQLVAETKRTFMAMLPNGHADRVLLAAGSNVLQDKMIIGRFIGTALQETQTNYDQILRDFLPGNIDRLTKAIEAINTQITGLETTAKSVAAASRNNQANTILATLTNAALANDLGNKLADLQTVYKNHDIPKLQKDVEAFGSKGKEELFATYNWFNESNYTYYVSPESIDKDLVTITANIAAKENAPCDPFVKTYEIKIRPKGGIKIDFSTGLFVNGGGNNFRDQTYRYDTVAGAPDKSVIARNKTKNALFPSVGALMHIYARNGKDFHFSGTFGISTKDLDKINYHLGGSAIFGYSQRFIISGGLTLTKATLIDDSYEVGQVVLKASAPDKIPTADFNRIGYFLAFTYNLTAK